MLWLDTINGPQREALGGGKMRAQKGQTMQRYGLRTPPTPESRTSKSRGGKEARSRVAKSRVAGRRGESHRQEGGDARARAHRYWKHFARAEGQLLFREFG